MLEIMVDEIRKLAGGGDLPPQRLPLFKLELPVF
jgi:hypothetical protein